jgi:hypothetical protein
MARRSMDITFVLTLLVGAFLLLDGIAGLTRANSLVGELGRAFGARGSTVNLIVALVELIAGALLLISLFIDLGRLQSHLGVGIFIAWIVIMVLIFVIGNFAPDTLGWWTQLSLYSIVLAVIWMVKGTRR